MLTYFTTILEMPVPIAVIVCEGDIDTIVHISEALKNKLPVIIMKGSGKAADLVFDFLEKYCIYCFFFNSLTRKTHYKYRYVLNCKRHINLSSLLVANGNSKMKKNYCRSEFGPYPLILFLHF